MAYIGFIRYFSLKTAANESRQIKQKGFGLENQNNELKDAGMLSRTEESGRVRG